MRKKDMILSIILIIIVIYLIANIGAINSFLSSSTDKNIKLDHSVIIVPEAWNTTEEINSTLDYKTNNSITNNYVVWDIWEDWPEDHIGDISHAKLKSMESGDYEVINSSVINLGGKNVSKEYFYNPTRDSDSQWDAYGVTYVFEKEDTNYAVQIHYFTKYDLNNESYRKELDDRMEDFMANIHNTQYDGFISGLNKVKNYIYNHL